MASIEYLETVIDKLRGIVPHGMFNAILSDSRAPAGGRARHRDTSANVFEKIAISDIRPRTIRGVDNKELSSLWLRLNQLFANAESKREAVENIVNAAVFVIDEFERRKLNFDESLPVARAALELREIGKDSTLQSRLAKLPTDLVVVKDFISIVGSTAKGTHDPSDMDILVRADIDDGDHALIGFESIWIPIRNALSRKKKGRDLHFITNPQGAHGDNIPLFDLVLRRPEELKTQIVKQAPTNQRDLTVSETFAAVEDQGKKFTKSDSGYIEPSKNPNQVCGNCRFFLRDETSAIGKCQVVEGDIAWFATSDLWISATEESIFSLGVSKEDGNDLDQLELKLDGNNQLEKQDLGEEGGTRSATGAKFWRDNWQDQFPKSGKGRFVYQHHWRGLTEDESKLGEAALLKTDNSLHGDLRFEAPDGLWGFTVFLGDVAQNRSGDRLIDLKPDDKLQGTFKLKQPKLWLDVGKRSPLIVEPGGVGATANAFAKFFVEDSGTYEMGVWRQNSFEVFLKGKELKGRLIIQFAPVEPGRRVWLISQPEDQTPIADREDKDKIIAELKSKRQKFLVWAKPGMRPEKINVRTANVEKTAKLFKVDAENRIVGGVVLDPYVIDKQKDIIRPKELEITAHGYLEKSRVIGRGHKTRADAVPVESFLLPYPTQKDYKAAMHDEPHNIYRMKIGNDKVHSGSWLLFTKINSDELWTEVENEQLAAYSIGGDGKRTKTNIDPMELVEQVIDIDGSQFIKQAA